MSTIPHNNRFTGLNALRFFAAYLVVLHHGETIRHKYGLPNFEGYSFFQNGALAVSFFFVLSGFLITYLLVVELHKTGDVALKKFYWRRILRIFPLYYLLVIIGLCVLPLLLHVMNIPNTQPYSTATGGVLFAFFLSFVVNALYSSHFLEPLWSIGVEEYFYLMWAPLFKFFRQKQTPNLAKRTLYIIGFIIVIKVIFILFFHFFPSENAIVNVVKEVILTLKFELMAIGGLGAYMVFYHREKLETAWFFKPIFQVIFFGFLFIRIFLHLYIIENSAFIYDVYKFMIFTPVIGTFTEGGLFLWLILNTAINARTFLPLKNKFLDNLGEISYGIYMYQMLVIFGIVLIFKKFMLGLSPVLSHLFFYSSVTIGVICLAWLSKRYFENPFLRLKKRLG